MKKKKLAHTDFAKLEETTLANIIEKVAAGDVPNAREQSILDRAKEKNAAPVAGEELRDPEPAGKNYAQSWDELADAIPIDERTLFNFRKTHDAIIKQRQKIIDRADGRHCISAWRELLDEFGVRARGVNNPDTSSIDVRALVLRERQLGVEREEFKLAKEKNLFLEVSECQAAFGATVTRFNAAVNALPGRASGKILPRARAAVIRALRKALDEKTFKLVDEKLPKDFAIDFADVEETLQAEIDLIKRTLSECDYLTPADNSAE